MLVLGIKKAEKFVKEQQALGNDVRWDGWDMVFFRAHPAAVYSVDPKGRANGVWRNGSYGFETRVNCNDKGLWEIDFKNVKRTGNTRDRSRRNQMA